VFFALVGLSALAMQPIQKALSRAMTDIRTNFIGKLENITGMEVRYDSIRPAFFGSFEIRNLTFNKNETPFFTVSLVKVNFSVIDLILKKNTAFHTVQINRPALFIDTERDKDTFELLMSLLDSGENSDYMEIAARIAEFLPREADYRIRNFYLNITDGDINYAFENMNMDVRGEENNFLLDMKFDAEVRHAGFYDKTIVIRTNVGITGSCSEDLQEGNAEIVLSSLTGLRQNVLRREETFFRPAVFTNRDTKAIFSVSPISASVVLSDKKITLSPSEESSNHDYHFSYDTEAGAFTAKMSFEDFLPGSFLVFYDYLEEANHLLDIPITGGLMFAHEGSSVDYNVDIRAGQQVRYTAQNPASIKDAFLIRMRGNEKNISVDDFCINSSPATARAGSFQGIVFFSGDMDFDTLKTDANVTFEHFSFTGNESLSAIFSISSSDNEIQIISDEIKAGKADYKKFEMYIHPSSGDSGITLLTSCKDSETIYMDAVYNNNSKQIDASLAFSSFPVFNIFETFKPFSGYFDIPVPPNNFTDKILLDTEIFFTSDFNHIVYNAPNITFKKDVILGIMSLSGTDRQFMLNESVFYLGENELYVTANAVFPNPMEFIFTLNANYLDLAWNIEGQILDRSTLIIRDPNGFNAYGSISNNGAMSGYVEAVDFPLPAADFPLYFNFYATLRYNSVDFWTVDIAHFTAGGLNLAEESPLVKLSGIADQDGASFRNILYSDRIGTLAGSADFFWDKNFSFFHFIVNMTDGNEAGEDYHFEGMLKESHVNVNANVSGMHLTRFLKGNQTVLVTGNADIAWDSINKFNANIDISSLYATVQDYAVRSSLSMTLSNDELLARDFNVDFAGIRTVVPFIHINRAEGMAVVNAGMHSYAASRHIQGEMELSAFFNPVNSWLDIKQAANSFDGTLKLENIEYKHFKNDVMAFDFSGDNGSYSVSGGIRDMFRLEMDEEGNFYMGLSEPMPIRGSIAGTLKNWTLDAHCGNFYIDVAHLYALQSIKDDDINIASGYATGKVDIKGPVFNPEFFGFARGTSLRIQMPKYISQDIRPVPFDLVAEGYEMTFGPVPVLCGNGGGTASGWFHFENWQPLVINIDVTVPRETPIPFNMSVTGVLADGDVSGKLNCVMDDYSKMIEIKGSMMMNKTELSVNMDEINISHDTITFQETLFFSGYNSKIDLTITTGAAVEFFWPNKTNPMLRITPEMGTVFKVYFDTEADQFTLISDIKIRSGEMYYFDRSFFIRQGSIVFNETESQFNPRISARAETRDRMDSGPVTISMIIENQPLLSFVPRFEASPSLTQLEIYSILGLNINIQGEESTDLVQQRFLLASSADLVTQLMSSSDIFGQLIFFRQFERRARTLLGLDMLSIRTRIIQNAVVSGVGGFGDSEPVDRNRVGNYFDNTTVSIGKYIGQDMFMHGTITMRYDENTQTLGGIKLEPDIGIEWQNPYFNIRWNFFPEHPQNWWVNDNSITLSWSRSY
jgi:hypothetical protein